jgi:hypothetical protein
LILSASILTLALSACAERRHFSSERSYSASSESASESCDTASDFWVFYPDGAFFAALLVDGHSLSLSGTYEVRQDSFDDDLTILLDTDGDEKVDLTLLGLDGASRIVWRRETDALVYKWCRPWWKKSEMTPLRPATVGAFCITTGATCR